jgi:hypothetical protein
MDVMHYAAVTYSTVITDISIYVAVSQVNLNDLTMLFVIINHGCKVAFIFCVFVVAFDNCVSAMAFMTKPDSKMTSKSIFLNELRESRSGNPIVSNKNPKNLDILLSNMIVDNPTKEPSSTASLMKFSKGKWDVVYAPHIKTLGKVLFADFQVFYKFLDIKDDKKLGIISNVYYDSKLFGKGWLNTQGVSSDIEVTLLPMDYLRNFTLYHV